MSNPIAQGYRSNSRLLTQGFGAPPSTTPLTTSQQSASKDDAVSEGMGDGAKQEGGTG
ncbi:MAG TPA: hypothetical protein VFB21_03640 [Chthonomonadaceae bacterium]|nr:hypothetical protein [Chthonomonadaceae bacterium]